MAMARQDAEDLESALGVCRQQMALVRQVHEQEEAKRLAKVEEEEAMLRSFIAALADTQKLIREEIGRLQEVVKTLCEDTKEDEARLRDLEGRDSITEASARMVETKTEVQRLRDALEKIDKQAEAARFAWGTARPENSEKEVWEAQIIALQDTRRMYTNEIQTLEVELHKLDRFIHAERQRRKAQSSGWSDLSRLQEQMVVTEAKADRAKTKLYFPEAKGYRFAGGGSKVYTGAKDLYISEVSGSFTLSAESMGRSADGEPLAKFIITLGGASMLKQQAKQQGPSNSSPNTEAPSPPPPSTGPLEAEGGASELPSPQPVPPPAAAALKTPPLSQLWSEQKNGASASAAANVPSPPCSSPPPAKGGPEDNLDTMSPSSNNSSALLEELSCMDFEPIQGRKRAGLKGKFTNFAVKLSSKAKPLKDRFHNIKESVKASAGASPGPEQETADMHTAAKNFSQKFAASFMATKNVAMGRRGRGQGAGGGKGWVQDLRGLSAAVTDRAATWELLRDCESVEETDEDEESAVEERSEAQMRSAPTLTDEEESAQGDNSRRCSAAFSSSSVDAERDREVAYADSAEELLASDSPGLVNSNPRQSSEADSDPEVLGGVTPPLEIGEKDGRPSDGGSSSINRPVSDPTGPPTSFEASDAHSKPRAKPGKQSSSFRRMSAAAAAAGGGCDAEGGAGSGRRRGVYILLRGENMGLVGEKGSKVPNATVREISLEVECILNIRLEYSRLKGWQFNQGSKGVDFEVLSLNHIMKGSSMPLPQTLLKAVLNLVLPQVVRRSILPAMPKELGEYLLDSGAGVKVGGEVIVQGPPLEALTVDLSMGQKGAQGGDRVGAESGPRQYFMSRSYKARTRRQGLEGQQDHLLAALDILGIDAAQAAVLAELFSTYIGLGEKGQKTFSIIDLCRFYSTYRSYPRLWHQICRICGTALNLLLSARGARQPHGTPDFGKWLDKALGPLANKQVSVQFAIKEVNSCLDCDTGLAQASAYFRRTLRELHEKGVAAAAGAESALSLPEALHNIDDWELALEDRLRGFKVRFQELGGTVVASADNHTFAIGLDRVRYIGPVNIKHFRAETEHGRPLDLQVPVDATMDEDGAFNWEMELPKGTLLPIVRNPDGTAYLRSDILDKLNPSAPAGAFQPGDKNEQAEGGSGHPLAMGGGRHCMEIASPYLARLVINRFSCSIEPDEAALADMLISQDSRLAATTIAAGLKDMLRIQFKPAFDRAADKERYLIQLETSNLSRAVMGIDSVGIQSPFSPAQAALLAYCIVRETFDGFTGNNPSSQQSADELFQTLYGSLARDALALCCCLEAKAEAKKPSGEGQEKHLRLWLNGGTSGGLMPLYLTNEVDLVPLMEALFEAPEIGF